MLQLRLEIEEIVQGRPVGLPERNAFVHLAMEVADLARDAQEILSVKCEIAECLPWFVRNKQHLLGEEFPFPLAREQSIGEAISSFYESVDPDDLAQLDKMYEYRTHHGLRFAFRGYDVNDVYIGRRVPHYCISCADDKSSWSYIVGLDAFFQDVELYAEVYGLSQGG